MAERRAATHELNGGLWDMLLAAEGLLAKGGNLCVLLPSERTAELQDLLHKLAFESVKQENFADRVMIWAKKH